MARLFTLVFLLLVGCSATGDVAPEGSGGSGGSGASSDGGTGGSGDSGSSGMSGSAGVAGSAASAGSGGNAGDAGNAGSSAAGSAGTAGFNTGATAGSAGSGTNECETIQAMPEVYAHGPGVLYKIDPITKTVTDTKALNCGDQVIDLAVNKDGDIYVTTYGGLATVDKNTGACALIVAGDFPNSLSFVPLGTLSPSSEVLVGYNGSIYVAINTTTGDITEIGSLGSGDLESSGDVVSVIGGGTYLTVTGSGCYDCLVEINPTTGAIIQNFGSIGYGAVYGLAFWAGTVYGFTNGGEIFSYDVQNHSASLVSDSTAPQFYGAGSTTCAPRDSIE